MTGKPVREDVKKTTFVSFSGPAGARQLAAELCHTADRALAPVRPARRAAARAVGVRCRQDELARDLGRLRIRACATSTTSASSFVRSATSTPASIASCSAPAHGTRGPMAIAWLASLRIGVLAALLLGPAAAIGVAARVPGLITGARDGFVVAAYLGAAVRRGQHRGCVPRSAWPPPGWRAHGTMRHRPRGLALTAGAAFTIACLAYLTLWWDASTLTHAAAVALCLDAGCRWRSPSRSACCSVTSSPSRRSRSRSDAAPARRRRSAACPDRRGCVLAAAGVLTFCRRAAALQR